VIRDEPGQDLAQIEQAAAGAISGRLGEWPHLKAALRRRGHHLLDWMPCKPDIQDLCREILKTSGT